LVKDRIVEIYYEAQLAGIVSKGRWPFVLVLIFVLFFVLAFVFILVVTFLSVLLGMRIV
jgi:hypothetical protein